MHLPKHKESRWISNMIAKGWGHGFAGKKAQSEFCRRIVADVMDCYPAKTDWVELTREDIERLYFERFSMTNLYEFARAIEKLVQDKNQ